MQVYRALGMLASGLSGGVEPPTEDLTALTSQVVERAALQKVLRPAARIPVLRLPHSYWESWVVDGSAADAVAGLERSLAVPASAKDFVYQLDRSRAVLSPTLGAASARVLVFTPWRWMDSAELHFKDRADGTCICAVHYHSTGVLPLTVWGAPVLNVLLAWVPFWHGGTPKRTTLPAIRMAMGLPVRVTGSGYPL